MTKSYDSESIDIESARNDHLAQSFYGYGRWDAPYWFIGPEPGMSKDGMDSLIARYESWKQLGYAPIVDCEKHHRGFGFTKWHETHPPTQVTWRQLIRLLLTYRGLPADTEAIREYQRTKWGSEMGETCVIELSGLAAPDMRTEQDRTTFLSRRILRIREAALKHKPEFIVMYGQGNREAWEQIAGGHFNSDGLRRMGRTVAAIALHPVTRGLGNDYWTNLGGVLRDVRNGFTQQESVKDSTVRTK